jgi:hypothetical protein
MSKASNIDSLAELHARQAEVKQETAAAKQGFIDSLTQAPGKVKQFAYEDLALPVMGVGLALYVGYRLLRSDNRPQESFSHAAPEPQHFPPAPVAESQQVRYGAPAVAPRPANPPRSAKPVASVAKSGLNLAAIISAGKIFIPAAQAIMSAVQDHKAQQANKSMEE